jgi:hypothetical protein
MKERERGKEGGKEGGGRRKDKGKIVPQEGKWVGKARGKKTSTE